MSNSQTPDDILLPFTLTVVGIAVTLSGLAILGLAVWLRP